MTNKKAVRIGETRRMNNGLIATIIEYHDPIDITVRFENGVVREHVIYGNFCRGSVSIKPPQKSVNYLGMTKRMNNGYLCTVTKVEDYRHIEVLFENGVKCHTTIQNFRNGKAGFSNDYKRNIRIGERIKQNNGLVAELIEYHDYHDITVKFENDATREHVRYSDFKNGKITINKYIRDRENREGRSFLQNNGLLFTITEYRSATDIDGIFETGEIREHIPFYQIENGTLCLHASSAWQKEYLGKQYLMSCGLHITVTDIKDCEDVTIRFDETGETRHVKKSQIDAKQCLPLGLSMKTRATHDFCGYRIVGRAIKRDGFRYYPVINLSTKEESLLTAQEMVAAKL